MSAAVQPSGPVAHPLVGLRSVFRGLAWLRMSFMVAPISILWHPQNLLARLTPMKYNGKLHRACEGHHLIPGSHIGQQSRYYVGGSDED
jgi:hypothetical protein